LPDARRSTWKARLGGLFAFLLPLVALPLPAAGQDYEREKRWADQTVPGVFVGEVDWLQQKNGHRFLALYTVAAHPRGAVIVAHGRGWSPDYELYGRLRTKIAEAGYTTLSIQMPVLDSTAKFGEYIPLYPDASERIRLATDFLKSKGYERIGIVSHSLGATMVNQYLIRTEDETIRSWVMISIIQGLQEMYRIHIPVLDVYGANDWNVTRWGAPERLKEIEKVPGSEQVAVPGAQHFFEGQEDDLVKVVVGFLDRTLNPGTAAAAPR
jgi:pimeloyl-ACP methyl ester carboxylesterase